MPAIPKRESELARPRSRKGGEVKPVTRGTLKPVTIPNAPRDWHPIARRMWDSLKTSGQTEFFQDSDWAFAYSLCDDLSVYKKPHVTRDGEEYIKRSPEMLKAILGGLERLMFTEVDRRKVRIELHEPEPEQDDAIVLAIAEYQADLGIEPEGD
jgi:hypothetical protein